MLTSAPFDGATILPLADARVQLRLTSGQTEHDAEVEAARDAAIGWAEGYTGHSLQEREWVWSVDRFCSVMRLPVGPVTTVDDVSYYDSDSVDTPLDAADWFLGNQQLVAAYGTTWPVANGVPGGVRVTFTAGYETPADIPPYLMAAVKLAMTSFFEERSSPDLSGAMRAADQFRAVLV